MPGLKVALFQLGQEAPFQGLGVRQQKHGQTMQVNAKLIAEDIGCVGQFRRYFREGHLNLLSATRGKALGLGAPAALPTPGLGIRDWGWRYIGKGIDSFDHGWRIEQMVFSEGVNEIAYDARLLRIARATLDGSAIPFRATLFAKSGFTPSVQIR
jgi:hypothetical protein